MELRVPEVADHIVAAIRARLNGHAGPFVVALDGGSGVGKSTLAVAVAAELGASVVHTNDFFASHRTGAEWEACTAAEKADLAIDWHRLRAQALEPLRAGRDASWHPFDFAAYDYASGSGLTTAFVTCQPTRVIVVDGIYSSRPELSDLIDLNVLVEAPGAVRRRPITSPISDAESRSTSSSLQISHRNRAGVANQLLDSSSAQGSAQGR